MAVQVVPPSVVSATSPLTAPAVVVDRVVTQQSWSSEQAISRAPTVPVGRAPACVHVEPVDVEMRATSPMAVVPTAIHRPSVRQLTALISATPLGEGTWVHTCPPSTVSMMTACVLVDWAPSPTAVQRCVLLQPTAER